MPNRLQVIGSLDSEASLFPAPPFPLAILRPVSEKVGGMGGWVVGRELLGSLANFCVIGFLMTTRRSALYCL
jgi:hypothetical protein